MCEKGKKRTACETCLIKLNKSLIFCDINEININTDKK